MEIFAFAMFIVTCLALLSGFPVAFTLSGIALLFALLGTILDIFEYSFLLALPQRIFGIMNNELLIAVPLFVFMGSMLERSRLAEKLLENMAYLFGSFRGGLGISVIIVGTLLAASTGIVGATVVTMGLLSLPTMLKHGYSPSLATGTICASGTLGQIIPPSIVLILLGDVIANAYQNTQLSMGIFSPETVSVGEIFAGALLPGLLLVIFYILYQIIHNIYHPIRTTIIVKKSDVTIKALIQSLFPPIALIITVLGSILMGIATPTEASAVGAIGTILLAGNQLNPHLKTIPFAVISLIILVILPRYFDLRLSIETISFANKLAICIAFLSCFALILGLGVSLHNIWKKNILRPVMENTTRITSMVFTILIGASLFSLVFRGLEGDEFIHHILINLPGGKITVLICVMLIMFVLGFFLDFIEITFVVVPIVAPILLQLGYDPIWLGVMMAVNLQTSFLTPPFGFALFYLRGVAPKTVTTRDIYRGVIPFLIIQIIVLILLAIFPEIITYLPNQIFS